MGSPSHRYVPGDVADELKQQNVLLLEACEDAIEIIRALRIVLDQGYRGMSKAYTEFALAENTKKLRAAIAECKK